MKAHVSVVIPCRNEEKYIADCLTSIINSDYQKSKLEIIVVDGQSDDRTAEIVHEYSVRYPYVRMLSNPAQIAPVAMNLGIKSAIGDFIFIISAHAIYPENYFSGLVFWAEKLKADCVGGVLITDVATKNIQSNSIKFVLSSSFGVGNSTFRTGIDKIVEVDTVAFGCYRKECFDLFGLFNEQLIRNQDIEFNKRIKNNGGKIYLVPEVVSTYFARETYLELAKNTFQNGYWNMLTVYITKNMASLSLRHFVPLFFTLSLLLPLLLTVWHIKFLLISVIILIFYLFLTLMITVKIWDRENNVFAIIWAFIVLHFLYGFGSLLGTIRLDILWKQQSDNSVIGEIDT